MIIKSLLDNDFYKFTMAQAVFHQFPSTEVEYEFKCRNENVDLTKIAQQLKYEVSQLCSLRFSSDELKYLSNIRFFKPSFIEFLRNLQLNPEYVHISVSDKLQIKIKGPWIFTIWFEIPILSLVNELYFMDRESDYVGAEKKLVSKIQAIENHSQKIVFSEFGTRRRFSRNWQKKVIEILAKSLDRTNFVGTSNVEFAKYFNLPVIGTMAHEWIMAMQALTKTSESQKFAFDCWSKEYRGDLGIALSDTLGSDAFFSDFDLYFSKLFDGARHDSGDPFEWCERLIQHYENQKIDSKTKVALFSDSLNVQLAKELVEQFADRINVRFGIGTNLTNDFPGLVPLNIVIKMTKCNNQPVAKISNVAGKIMCNDAQYISELKRIFSIQ